MEYMILLTIMHNLNQFFYVTEDKKVIEYQLFINLTSRKRRNRFGPFRLITTHRCFPELYDTAGLLQYHRPLQFLYFAFPNKHFNKRQ